MKKILGLDLGTNSIGWAVINKTFDSEGKEVLQSIENAGSRIIPMDATILTDFERGNSISQTANRTKARSTRRLYERACLRRERLNRVLSLIGFLPEHYSMQLDRYGKFMKNGEPKLAWSKDEFGKYHFIFEDSFLEMVDFFKKRTPEIVANSRKLPYDWTIYYLRKKALTQKINKEELAWILLNFNQKRGYFQLRDEEEEQNSSKTRQYFDRQEVIDIVDTQEIYKGLKVLQVILANGTKGKIFKKEIPDWVGQEKNIIVTVDIDKQGKDKYEEDGSLSCRFRIPTENEWETEWKLIKEKTQHDLEVSNKTVGEYIFDSLLNNPMQKVRGKLVRTIERKYYKKELQLILEKQRDFHSELNDLQLYNRCLEELYPNNPSHRSLMRTHDLSYFLINDILFYQRPLKSKKSLIDDCPYEGHEYIDNETKEKKYVPIKCIAKSHPLYQEFRVWQFLSNIRIYQKEKYVGESLRTDVDVTQEFLRTENDYVELFDWLNNRKEIDQKQFFKYPAFGLKKNIGDYRWNYVEDKLYPCNETRAILLTRLDKAGISNVFLTPEHEEALWHILYSVSSKQELRQALTSFSKRYNLNEKFVETFLDTPPFEKSYGAYSAKAIKKLLPLMRMGYHWNADMIDKHTLERINKILNGEYDETIGIKVREKAIHLVDLSSFRGLPLWLACYVVYGRHSEVKDLCKWIKPEDIDEFLKEFKQYSLRNPIVEQIVLETMRTVRDIWRQSGRIDEIHVELGREMKSPADKRKKISQRIQENENTNLRIKTLLIEFMNPEMGIENVRPHSPSQQDLLRIYEEGAWDSSFDDDERDEMLLILKKFNEVDDKKRPTLSDIKRYRLWLEQKYRSPYTGNTIPLSKLFTTAYEIEHIIPKSRFFDDSLSNKVICESEVNKLKDKQLGYEFIKNHHGEKVLLSSGQTVEILSVESYEHLIKDCYAQNSAKKKKLLMDEIPEQFTERQMNDSRYISKLVVSLLSNIVREDGEEESTSKNIVVCTGGVTDRLKKDWGINDVWNKIVLPRFERMNYLTDSSDFTSTNSCGHLIPAMPLHLQKGFSKKRIDHRHHAMDAIVIACANRNIVNYLNNESASGKNRISRYDLQCLLCNKVTYAEGYKWIIKKPWESFTQDVYSVLTGIIVSFKQNLRVINKTTNYYQRKENGKTIISKQDKGDCWSIRKPLHKETVFGEVNLRKEKTVSLKEALANVKFIINKELKHKLTELINQGWNEKQIKEYFEKNKDIWQDVNLKKIPIYYFTKDTKERYFASRKLLDDSFDKKAIESSITDTGIQTILLKHLEIEGGDPKIAFSPEGIERMNKNIKELNGGIKHKPIYKVRKYEKAEKFAVGQRGNKSSKFVEAAKGTNLYFAIYEEEAFDNSRGELVKHRTYATIPLNIVISRLKDGLQPVPANADGVLPKFVLSPNDLVYIPTPDEIKKGLLPAVPDSGRIYKMVSSSGSQCFFIPFSVASLLCDKKEYSPLNKMERAVTNEMIKEICVPLNVDRLGNISYKI